MPLFSICQWPSNLDLLCAAVNSNVVVCSFSWWNKSAGAALLPLSVGLLGVVIILQPSIMIFGLPALLPLAAAFSHGWIHNDYPAIGGQGSPLSDTVYSWGYGNFSAWGYLADWADFDIAGTSFIIPNAQQIEWIIYMGLVATIGHLLIVWAANNTPANVLAPFQYTEIISSVILGYLVFKDLPAKSTVLGVGIIVTCGVYLFHRERINNQQCL